ncbi:M48 family metallopeptidase [Gottfriedia acidiceleris]|uniref:M48 family metallopeptidase n=1 Tax=Gottfriedia acidiceleris TaxID=371036 RepID=A0ABY4JH94_9BACI|nr:SprT family zinc-dependent metalloprotease [Gottfriedia acidiceleris]UPM52449.1 M48 family metallopeptidase [Gottfriedia acidiceleris]
MSIKTIKISNIDVEIEKKNIKNLHLGVYPPNGRVRVAAPMKTTDESIRLMIISKISWIKKQQNKFQSQLRQSQREYVSGESHYLWGTRYLLNVIYHKGAAKVIIRNKKFIDLYVRDGTSRDQRERVMTNWYREQIKAVIPDIIQKWEPLMNVAVDEWRVKAMKTKWGTCNVNAKRIWLNLHLVKKPPQCIEYVVVHEMVHLKERTHNSRFVSLMDNYYPNWRTIRDELNMFMLDFVESFKE